MRRASGFLALLLVTSAGCVPRERLNVDCSWHGDPAGALDLTRRADRTHLAQDLIVAEELAVRYADRRVVAPRAPTREACMAQLLPLVAGAHGLAVTDLAAVRAARDPIWDASLWTLIAAGYVAAAGLLVRWLRARIDPGAYRLGVMILFAFPAALVGVALGELISLVAEGARVSNLGHLSGFRGDRIPWRHHRAELMVAGVALFWCVGAFLRCEGPARHPV